MSLNRSPVLARGSLYSAIPCQRSSCKREVPCRGGGGRSGEDTCVMRSYVWSGGLGGGLYSEVQCIMAIDHMGTPPRGQNDRFD